MPSISIQYFRSTESKKQKKESFVRTRSQLTEFNGNHHLLLISLLFHFLYSTSQLDGKGKEFTLLYEERGMLSSAMRRLPHYHPPTLDSGWKLESILCFFIAFVRNWHEFPRFSFFFPPRVYGRSNRST